MALASKMKLYLDKNLLIWFFLSQACVFAQAVKDTTQTKPFSSPVSLSFALLHTSQTEVRNNYKYTATCYYKQNAFGVMLGGANDDTGKKREISIQYDRFGSSDYHRSFLYGFESMYLVYTPKTPDPSFSGISFGPNIGYQKTIFKGLFIRGQIGFYLFAARIHSDGSDRSRFGILPNLRINLGWIFNDAH